MLFLSCLVSTDFLSGQELPERNVVIQIRANKFGVISLSLLPMISVSGGNAGFLNLQDCGLQMKGSSLLALFGY